MCTPIRCHSGTEWSDLPSELGPQIKSCSDNNWEQLFEGDMVILCCMIPLVLEPFFLVEAPQPQDPEASAVR